MRAEKQFITKEYIARLNASPFFVVVDYRGLTVTQFTDLRKRLSSVGAEVHVVKNSMFRIAAKEAGLADLAGALDGQLAVITGRKDIASAAKEIKGFHKLTEKPKVKFGYLSNHRLEASELLELADLPPMEVLRAKLLGLLQSPASALLRLMKAPSAQLATVLQAKADKEARAAA